MLKCIKIYCTHWGTFFHTDGLYDIHSIRYAKYDIITNYDLYRIGLSIGSTAGTNVVDWKNLKHDEKMNIRSNHEKSEKIIKESTLGIEISYAVIIGDDGNQYSFCIGSKLELEKKYGTSKFRTTVEFLEDYFFDIQKLRNEKILGLLEE